MFRSEGENHASCYCEALAWKVREAEGSARRGLAPKDTFLLDQPLFQLLESDAGVRWQAVINEAEPPDALPVNSPVESGSYQSVRVPERDTFAAAILGMLCRFHFRTARNTNEFSVAVKIHGRGADRYDHCP